ncbi:hypothetical protein, partial [Ostreibacterium oceani]|uniref:hypothetical protein n=1 Tax=Ostreibacterium oceani TaxID=2654998 RepID=UPI001C40264E
DETLYDNLSETSRPAGWDSLIVPPDLLVGSGEYDAFVTGPELAVGDSVGEFVIRFEWLGMGEPGVQPFSIIDPVTFVSVFDGTTVIAPNSGNATPAAIPSVSSWGLLSLMLSLMLCFLAGSFMLSYRQRMSAFKS